MMKTNEVLRELRNISYSIKKIVKDVGYECSYEFDNLELDKTNPEDIFFERELGTILDTLEAVQDKINYVDLPIKCESKLHRNSDGRYETEEGDCFTCGSIIEYLCNDERYGDYPFWRKSVVEHSDERYYIVGEPNLSLNGVLVRVRRFN